MKTIENFFRYQLYKTASFGFLSVLAFLIVSDTLDGAITFGQFLVMISFTAILWCLGYLTGKEQSNKKG